MDKFTVVYEPIEDGWWLARCVEVPEALTQGATPEEAQENIREAIQLVLESKREIAERQARESGGRIAELSL